ITSNEFEKLRDGFEYEDNEGERKSVPGLFNEVVFSESIREFLGTKERLANYFDESLEEDIFDYIPPQKTNQIFTPRRVVKMMVDTRERENPNIFKDKTKKFADLYVKSGLYIMEIVKRLNEGLKGQMPNQQERVKWILENQVYACAPSNIIYNIVKNFILGKLENISAPKIIELDTLALSKTGILSEKIYKEFGDENMKFDVIIGNPPFQDETADTSDNPIYHLFMQESYKVSEKVMLITPGRFLFNAGKTPKSWNEKMLNDPHLKVVYYEQESSKVFPNTDITGGIAITYRDKSKEFEEIGTFTKYPELNSILDKVTGSESFTSIIDSVYPQNKFNLDVLYQDYPSYKSIIGSAGREKRLTTSIIQQIDVFTKEPTTDEDIKLIGLINNKRVFRYIKRKYIEDHQNLDSYKVILPKSNGSGAIGTMPNTPLIGVPILGMPSMGYTQSFISIGSFKTEFEGESALKY